MDKVFDSKLIIECIAMYVQHIVIGIYQAEVRQLSHA